MTITTANLCLIPLSLEEFELLLNFPEKLTEKLNFKEAFEALNAEMKLAFEWLYKQCKTYPQYHIWYTAWLITLKSDNVPIGSLCFKGEPDFNGEVEIGYCIYRPYQKHGYMSETIEVLINWLSQKDGIKTVVAETNKDNIQSQNVLIKNGFTKYRERDEMFWWRRSL